MVSTIINVLSSFAACFTLAHSALILTCQIVIGGRGGHGGYERCSARGERGSAYDNDASGALLPGSGGGGGAGYPYEGGAGGAGGAAVLLYAEEIIINGIIKVNGDAGGRGPNNGK